MVDKEFDGLLPLAIRSIIFDFNTRKPAPWQHHVTTRPVRLETSRPSALHVWSSVLCNDGVDVAVQGYMLRVRVGVRLLSIMQYICDMFTTPPLRFRGQVDSEALALYH